MPDVLNQAQRSYCMSRIRSRDTQPEVRLRKALWKAGYRYKLKSKLPGKPDLVFPARKTAIFVDGCFWHLCPKHAVSPRTNRPFWDRKLKTNKERDRAVNKKLRGLGWRVLRVWEHEVEAGPERAAARLIRKLGEKHQ